MDVASKQQVLAEFLFTDLGWQIMTQWERGTLNKKPSDLNISEAFCQNIHIFPEERSSLKWRVFFPL